MHLAKQYKAVFNTPDGQEVLNHLMKESGMLSMKIETDYHTLLIRQGQQHIVKSILRITGRDLNKIAEQIKESASNEELDKV